MAYYLQMNGTSDYIIAPSMTYNSITLDGYFASGQGVVRQLLSGAGGFFRVNADDSIGNFYTTYSGFSLNVRTTLNVTLSPAGTGNTTIFARNQGTYGDQPAKGNIYDVKFYNGATLVAHYDMTLGNVLDQSGNGNNATLTGGTWVSDATGTTYSGGGTASGLASASSSEHFIYTARGTDSGVASASSSETVIAASTTYSGTGTASGTSSASSTQTVTFASSGTAQGSASVVGSVAVPTTYTGSGTASGIASVIARELLLSARGTPLKRAYVFQDQSSLVATQVDVNFKTLFDYLGSQVIGIGLVIASGATIASITGIVQNDTQYLVTVIPSWNTTSWITGKTTSGFTINFGTAPASTSTLDWRLMR